MSTSKMTKRKARTPKPDTHTTTMAWHQPKCNACKEPILDMHDALAVCFMDRSNQSHTPMLLHVGDCFRRLRETRDLTHSIHVVALHAQRQGSLQIGWQ